MYPVVAGLLIPLAQRVFDLQRQGDIGPYLAIFAFGFLLGIIGHLTDSVELVLAGILIAGVAAIVPWIVWG